MKTNEMKKQFAESYVAPQMEVIEVMVEKGFAQSAGGEDFNTGDWNY